MIRRILAHVPEFLVLLFIAGLIGLFVVAALNRKYSKAKTCCETGQERDPNFNCRQSRDCWLKHKDPK